MLEIRPERVDDLLAIRELIAEVFAEAFGSRVAEANRVETLRFTGAHVPSFTFVAPREGQVVGHFIFGDVRTSSGGEE